MLERIKEIDGAIVSAPNNSGSEGGFAEKESPVVRSVLSWSLISVETSKAGKLDDGASEVGAASNGISSCGCRDEGELAAVLESLRRRVFGILSISDSKLS